LLESATAAVFSWMMTDRNPQDKEITAKIILLLSREYLAAIPFYSPLLPPISPISLYHTNINYYLSY
jgi:hypothetical protein